MVKHHCDVTTSCDIDSKGKSPRLQKAHCQLLLYMLRLHVTKANFGLKLLKIHEFPGPEVSEVVQTSSVQVQISFEQFQRSRQGQRGWSPWQPQAAALRWRPWQPQTAALRAFEQRQS
jgi:hypothetical protein